MNSSRGRRRLLMLAIAALVALPLGSARGASTTVIERAVSYVPGRVEIAPGDTVVWTFESAPASSARHTVTFEDGTDLNPACPALVLNDCQDTPGETVQRRFTTPGPYSYYCKIHRSQGMVGVVVVSAATTTTASAPTTTMLPRQTTTSSTARASTSSTTATTRPLATSSTFATSTTTSTTSPSSVLLPGDPPAFPGDGTDSAAGRSGGSDGGSDTRTVALIVALLLGVAAAGGYLLWRLRPGRVSSP